MEGLTSTLLDDIVCMVFTGRDVPHVEHNHHLFVADFIMQGKEVPPTQPNTAAVRNSPIYDHAVILAKVMT